MSEAARSATQWMLAAMVLTAAAFALFLWALPQGAALVGVAASLLLALAGLRVSRAGGEGSHDTIDYPYDVRQRGRRLAWVGLAGAASLAGFGLAPDLVMALLGASGFVLVAGVALLAPALGVTLAVWVVDGLTLREGLEAAGDPLIGAVASMTLGLLLAVGAATAGLPATLEVLVLLGGLIPSLFVLWSLARLHASLDEASLGPVA